MTVGMVFAIAMDIGFAYAAMRAGRSMYRTRANCTELGEGRYLGKKVYKPVYSGSRYKIKPEFEVVIQGKTQTICAMDDLSRHKWKELKEGQIYTIYVNPKKPEEFRCTTKVVYVKEVFWWVAGGFAFYSTIIICIGTFLNYVYHHLSW